MKNPKQFSKQCKNFYVKTLWPISSFMYDEGIGCELWNATIWQTSLGLSASYRNNYFFLCALHVFPTLLPREKNIIKDLQFCRFTESKNMLNWKRPSRIIEANSLCYPKSHTMCLRALSKFLLNSVRLGVVTISLGSLFQCPRTLWVKISILNLPWLIFL